MLLLTAAMAPWHPGLGGLGGEGGLEGEGEQAGVHSQLMAAS